MTDDKSEKSSENPDLANSVIIRRHDDTVYAIPLEDLEKYRIDPALLEFDQKALVQTLGCFTCRSVCRGSC